MKYPESALTKILNAGLHNNISYLKHYKILQSEFSAPETCQSTLEEQYFVSFKQKIVREAENDCDSRLGTYYRVNPTLQKYVSNPQYIMEIERELVTHFRTGSYSLAIELGRYSNTARENRCCICGDSVQTL